MGCSPWGREELGTTERLHFYFSLSCIGEGNGNPLQCSCLENPRDGEPGGLPSMGSHRVGHDYSDLAAATILSAFSSLLSSCWGFSFSLGHGIYFFGGIQHSPVDSCSAASCNFGVFTGEDEHTSFYTTIL